MADVDQTTLALIAEVKKRKEEISKANKPQYRTNMSFNYNEDRADNSSNLHVEGSVDKLIKIAAYIMSKKQDYDEAVKLMQLDDAPAFTWKGFSAEDWIEDIKARISKINVAKMKQKLETLEARLDKIMSPELRQKLELEAIMNELK